jgi:hypothetical protein
LQEPYTKCISAYSSWENGVFAFTSCSTLLTTRTDCTVCCLRYYWLWCGYMNTSTPAPVICTSTTKYPLRKGPICI